MMGNMYPKLEKACLQILSYGNIDLKKVQRGKVKYYFITH